MLFSSYVWGTKIASRSRLWDIKVSFALKTGGLSSSPKRWPISCAIVLLLKFSELGNDEAFISIVADFVVLPVVYDVVNPYHVSVRWTTSHV